MVQLFPWFWNAGLANMAFPAAVLAVQQAAGHLTLAGCAKMLAAVLAAVLGSKALLEGPGSYPSYGAGGRRAAGTDRSHGPLSFPPSSTLHHHTGDDTLLVAAANVQLRI